MVGKMVGKYGNTWKLQASAFKHIMQNICCSTKRWKLAEWWWMGCWGWQWFLLQHVSPCLVVLLKCLIALDEKIKVFTSHYSIITIVAMAREQKWNKLTLVNDDANHMQSALLNANQNYSQLEFYYCIPVSCLEKE